MIWGSSCTRVHVGVPDTRYQLWGVCWVVVWHVCCVLRYSSCANVSCFYCLTLYMFYSVYMCYKCFTCFICLHLKIFRWFCWNDSRHDVTHWLLDLMFVSPSVRFFWFFFHDSNIYTWLHLGAPALTPTLPRGFSPRNSRPVGWLGSESDMGLLFCKQK